MKKIVLFILLQFSMNIFSQMNIYEDALTHLILEDIEDIEKLYVKTYGYSMFNHEIILVKNDIVDMYIHIPSINNYKIKIISDVKLYLDTVKKNHPYITIYEMSAMKFIPSSEGPFRVDFVEYCLVKKNNKIEDANSVLNSICYEYVEHKRKKRKELKYSYWGSAGGFNGRYTFAILRKKGWIDY